MKPAGLIVKSQFLLTALQHYNNERYSLLELLVGYKINIYEFS